MREGNAVILNFLLKLLHSSSLYFAHQRKYEQIINPDEPAQDMMALVSLIFGVMGLMMRVNYYLFCCFCFHKILNHH